MAGTTVSAWVDEPVAVAVQDLAKLEERKPAQIAGAAVRLYTQLSADARHGLRAVQAYGTPEEQAWMMRELARVIIRAQAAVADRMMGEDLRANAGKRGDVTALVGDDE